MKSYKCKLTRLDHNNVKTSYGKLLSDLRFLSEIRVLDSKRGGVVSTPPVVEAEFLPEAGGIIFTCFFGSRYLLERIDEG